MYPLWRGVPEFNWKNKRIPIRTIKVDQSRQPRDTSILVHNLLDLWFNEKTGVKYRSQSVFVSGSKDMAIKYATDFGTKTGGSSVIVLPIGDFSYCWSPEIEDLYNYVDHNLFDVTEPIIPEKIKELLEGKYYNNEQLKAAIVSGHEIMIHCKKFIIMADYYVDYLLDNYK